MKTKKLSNTDVIEIKNRISTILSKHAGVSPVRTIELLPYKALKGKLYEADVLSRICENLVTKEGFKINFIGRHNLLLRQKGGPIKRTYPHFKVMKGAFYGELFTDIYFNTLSYQIKGSLPKTTKGDYHEIDIALVKEDIPENTCPKPSDIIIAVECKNTSIKKNIIRELLGFRRELSVLTKAPITTMFTTWPIDEVNAFPNSVHMLYCSNKNVKNYEKNCKIFGTILEHYKM